MSTFTAPAVDSDTLITALHQYYGTPAPGNALLLGIATSGPAGIPVTVTTAAQSLAIFGQSIVEMHIVPSTSTTLSLQWSSGSAFSMEYFDYSTGLFTSDSLLAPSSNDATATITFAPVMMMPISYTATAVAGVLTCSVFPAGVVAGMVAYEASAPTVLYTVTIVGTDNTIIVTPTITTTSSVWEFRQADVPWRITYLPTTDRFNLHNQASLVLQNSSQTLTLMRVNGTHASADIPTGIMVAGTNTANASVITCTASPLAITVGMTAYLYSNPAIQGTVSAIDLIHNTITLAQPISIANSTAVNWIVGTNFVIVAANAGNIVLESDDQPYVSVITGMRGQPLFQINNSRATGLDPIYLDLTTYSTLGQLADIINQYAMNNQSILIAYAPNPDAPALFTQDQFLLVSGTAGVLAGFNYTADPTSWYDQLTAMLPMVDLGIYDAVHIPLLLP